MTSQQPPQRFPNRPGLAQLAYRIGDYASVKERLIAQLPETVNFLLPEASSASLAGLTTRSQDDFAIALIDAWAVVADVLTFYQERIANEGYLLTATERRSVLALARAIGYELDPGVAASTYLSFTVEEAPDSPTVVAVPKGTQVMSVPVKDELPQTFETVEDLTAYLAWNAIKPRSQRPQVIDETTKQLYLSGTSTRLNKDDLLLIVDAAAKAVTPTQKYVLKLSEVEEDTDADRTLVSWQRSFPAIETRLQQPQVFVFRQQAHLFGYNAPDWEIVPAEAKLAAVAKGGGAIQGGVLRSRDNGAAWAAVSQGLPNSDILCMSARGQALFVGTPDKGVFRSLDGGVTWAAANEGVTSQNVLALHRAADESAFNGAVFAGTPNGGVFRSKDGGNNWVAINTGTVRVESRGNDEWQSINTSLPNTVVRSLLTYSNQSNLGTGTISSEGTTVRGDNTAFVSEVRVGDEITALGQQRTVTAVNSETSLTINAPFSLASLPSDTEFSASINVSYRLGSLSPSTPRSLTVQSGSISSEGNQVRGEGTRFRELTNLLEEVRAFNNVTNIASNITITAVGRTLTVNRIDSDTRLVTNGSFTRNYLDAGTAFLLPTSRFKSFIFVGTDEGIYRSQDQGENWISRNLAEQIVSALHYVDDGSVVLAATDIGIFRSTDDGQQWSSNTFSEARKVFCLSGYGAQLFAGTSAGILRSTNQGQSWSPISSGDLAQSSVRSLATYARGGDRYLFAATNQGVWVSQNSDQAVVDWQLASEDLVAQSATVLAYSESTKSLYAGTQFKGFLPTDVSESAAPQSNPQSIKAEWPEFALQALRQVDLDTLYPQILSDSWMLLFRDRHPQNPQQEAEAQVRAHQIDDVAAIDRSDFGLSGKITRLALNTDIVEPESFGLRSTQVFIQSEPLALALEPLTVVDRQSEIFADPVANDTLYLSGPVPFLQPEQTVIVSGQHMRARLAEVGGVLRAEYEWQPRHQHLRNLVINILSVSENVLQFVGTDEGLYRWQGNEHQWEPIAALDYRVIRAVWQDARFGETLLVGADQRLYRSPDRGLTWQIITDSQGSGISETVVKTILAYEVEPQPASQMITAISGVTLQLSAPASDLSVGDVITVADAVNNSASAPQSRVIVAVEGNSLTVDAVFQPAFALEDNPEARALSFANGGKLLFVGTEQGIYRSTDDGQTWRYLSGLRSHQINDLSIVLIGENYELLAASDRGLHRSQNNGERWSPISEISKPVLSLFPRELLQSAGSQADDYLWAGTEQGLYFSADRGVNWTLLLGLRDRQILSLATHTIPNSTQTILFAGCDQGVYRSRNQGQTWESIDAGLPASAGRALVVLGNNVVVGTEQGVFASAKGGDRSDPLRWGPSNTGLENSQVLSLAVSASGTEAMVGTTAGAFYSTDGGRRWQELSDGLTPITSPNPLPVSCLLAAPQDNNPACWYAGTPAGLFCWQSAEEQNEPKEWRSLHTGLAYTDILTMHLLGTDLLVGTRTGGLLRFSPSNISGNPAAGRWSPTALNNTDVQTVAIANNYWYAGTRRDGLYRSLNSGRTWQQITQVRSGSGTLTSNGLTLTWRGQGFDGRLAAGDVITAQGQSRTVLRSPASNSGVFTIDRPFKPDLEPNTAFTINTGLTNRNITALAAVPVAGKPPTLYAGTAGSGVFRSRDGGDRWTQIITNLEDLEIRTLMLEGAEVLWAGTAQKGVFRSINEGDLWAPVNTYLTNLDVRALVRPNRDSSLMVGGIGILISDDQLLTTPVQRNDLVHLLSAPKTQVVKAEEVRSSRQIEEFSYQAWAVRTLAGIEGIMRTPLSRPYPLLPADAEDPIVSEVAVIQYPPTSQKRPVLLLKDALTYSYDPATVSVHANVAAATHGETIQAVLGSGDGNETYQQFELKKPPLTYVSAPTASGSQSTLDVRVEGVLWAEAPSLYPLTPQDQQYVVRIEDDGTTRVSFGDGRRGARLPSGDENITATYRSGIGTDGNVSARQLTILKTRPQGITDVINPLAATGAANPERLEEAQVKAPPTVRTLDRIVSLQDFEDFAQGFVGVGKAQAAALWNGATQLVHITVAGIQGAAVPEVSRLYRQLVQAIDRARDPIQQVVIASYDRQLFNVEARLLIDPRYESEVVLQAVKVALQERFQFDTQAFGQAVTSAEAIASIQSVAGVTAVDLDALYRVGESKELATTLAALPARYLSQTMTLAPAQLLLLNPVGIQLAVVPAL
ncbi:MAG: putative baseplate assembly protein [Phormidesmis sp.]